METRCGVKCVVGDAATIIELYLCAFVFLENKLACDNFLFEEAIIVSFL